MNIREKITNGISLHIERGEFVFVVGQQRFR